MSKQSLLPESFSHIYVEQKALTYKMTSEVLSRFKGSTVILIKHYKDVFNRPGQDSCLQNLSKSLILAVNEGKKIFDGAPVCQDFGAGKFYYAESAMNCVFSCDYCFLKGMYGTSNIVIFVNSDDYLDECSRLSCKEPLYICASFDTDLAALSGICPWHGIWEEYAAVNDNAVIELRTKSALKKFISRRNLIYAFTLSPDRIIDLYEKGTPSLSARLKTVNEAIRKGACVRLCFDPMIYIKDYELCYNEFIDRVLLSVDLDKVKDISIGTFRISSEYLSGLRKASAGSSAVLFPFDRRDKVCGYPEALRAKMIGIIQNKLEASGYGSKVYVI